MHRSSVPILTELTYSTVFKFMHIKYMSGIHNCLNIIRSYNQLCNIITVQLLFEQALLTATTNSTVHLLFDTPR